VTGPGPDGVPWALALLAYGALLGIVGEAVRHGAARFLPIFRTEDRIERLVLDIYLGVGLLYGIALIPGGLDYPATLPIVAAVAVAYLVWERLRQRRTGVQRPAPATKGRLPQWVAVAAAIALLVLELVVAEGAAAGNTYDSSLYALYSTLLGLHHSLPWSLQPSAAVANAFPPGATVVFGNAQMLFALPPPRTALLVTPLFIALAPLAGYALGRRWMGSPAAGAALALLLALMVTFTRELVSGSNDFVLAVPLILLLLAWTPRWVEGPPIDYRWAVGFGVIAGIAAALNPVGPEWIFLLLPVAALLHRPAWAGRARSWWSGWGLAAAIAVLFTLPSLVVALGEAGSASGYLAAESTPATDPLAAFIGWIDPYLFRPPSVQFSSSPLLHAELALLLSAGLVLLLVPATRPAGRLSSRWAPLAGAGIMVAILAIGLEVAARAGVDALDPIARLSNPAELSALLFTAYAILAAFPLAFLIESLGLLRPLPETSAASSDPVRGQHRSRATSASWTVPLAMLLALAVLVPGVVVTSTALPPSLSTTYTDFGNVTAADYSMLEWAATNLPSGARVLVAPGSAAQFLPSYQPSLVPVFLVLPQGESTNASYQVAVGELSNGTLAADGTSALNDLGVEYVAVTQANTVLWPPFLPVPLQESPTARVMFHSGDAWIFEWLGPRCVAGYECSAIP
jgi:hypothetical protein